MSKGLRNSLGGVLYAKPARIRRLRISSSEHASRSSAGSTGDQCWSPDAAALYLVRIPIIVIGLLLVLTIVAVDTVGSRLREPPRQGQL